MKARCGKPTSMVAIQHENDVPELLPQGALLRLVKRRTHQGHHGRPAGLVQFQTVEEAFHHDDGLLAGGSGAVPVEEDLRFGESGGEPVAGLASTQRAATIGHQFCPLIVDGDDQPSAEDPRPAIEADAELLGRGSWIPREARYGCALSMPRRVKPSGAGALFFS
jgi:hypothetical protein